MSRHEVARTGSFLLPDGNVTRQRAGAPAAQHSGPPTASPSCTSSGALRRMRRSLGDCPEIGGRRAWTQINSRAHDVRYSRAWLTRRNTNLARAPQ
jgi:hypothetical protein